MDRVPEVEFLGNYKNAFKGHPKQGIFLLCQIVVFQIFSESPARATLKNNQFWQEMLK